MKCRRAVHLNVTWKAVESEYQRMLMEEHRPALEHLRRRIDERLHRAEAIVGLTDAETSSVAR